ncbi:MAG: TetR/AcrR family transcriptional regulator [Vicinamibacterales bacterium]
MEDTSVDSPSPPTQAATEPDDAVRTRLLNAAVRVFDRKGYSAASVREVAEMAGVTKPALYYHFGSKEGLLVAILEQAKRQLEATLERAVARTGTARGRILALCEDTYGLFGQNVPIARVAHAVFLGPPDGAPPFDVTVFEARLRQAMERIAADGVAAGEFRDVEPGDIALAVMGVLEGCNERQLHPAFEPVGLEGLHRLVNLLFDGAATAPRM